MQKWQVQVRILMEGNMNKEEEMQFAGEKLTLMRQKAEEEKEDPAVRGHGKDTRMYGPRPRAWV